MNDNAFATSASWETQHTLEGSRSARAFSPSNIALAKYWGKRDLGLNLPANGSISATLKDFGSFTTVEFHPDFAEDTLILDGMPADAAKVRVVLDAIRARASSIKDRARVQSRNNFPTGAGLASSASGLSAVALAAAGALGLDLPRGELSAIARRGSGSASRSLFGGYVEWKRGERADGSDSLAEPIASPEHWPLAALVAIVEAAPKGALSTGAMERTRATSPYFEAWVEAAQKSIAGIRAAILARDFDALAVAAESNCLRMHACAMAAEPPIVYWRPATLAAVQRVRELRAGGTPVFFTIDAGPNVVVFCEASHAARARGALAELPGVHAVLRTEVGEGARWT